MVKKKLTTERSGHYDAASEGRRGRCVCGHADARGGKNPAARILIKVFVGRKHSDHGTQPAIMKSTDRTGRNNEEQVSDEQLLLRYTQGDAGAFERLVHRYYRELYHFLARFLGDATLAEDVFQETFLQVHLSADGFDVSRRLKPWLFTIAANKARDALRRLFRRPAAELDAEVSAGNKNAVRFVDLMPANIPSPDERIQNREAADAVQNIVRRMPENLRTVLLLCYFHDFTYKEIAEILDVPLGTVKSRLHLAVKEFARRWKAAGIGG